MRRLIFRIERDGKVSRGFEFCRYFMLGCRFGGF